MQNVDVTSRVWNRILAVRAGQGCLCSADWSCGEEQALALYGPLAQPLTDTQVIAQIGQSLDGRIATVSGDSRDISGEDGLAHLHRLRSLCDAIVIGVQTAVHDNPQLTVRLAPGKNPVRVVIDPNGRMPNDMALMQDQNARCIVIQSVDVARPAGVDVIKFPQSDCISPTDILAALRERGLHRILIEGGTATIAKFLEAKVLSRLHVAIAPLLIGAGPQGLTMPPVARLADALRPKTEIYNLGSDVVFDCILDPDHSLTSLHPLPCRTMAHEHERAGIVR